MARRGDTCSGETREAKNDREREQGETERDDDDEQQPWEGMQLTDPLTVVKTLPSRRSDSVATREQNAADFCQWGGTGRWIGCAVEGGRDAMRWRACEAR